MTSNDNAQQQESAHASPEFTSPLSAAARVVLEPASFGAGARHFPWKSGLILGMILLLAGAQTGISYWRWSDRSATDALIDRMTTEHAGLASEDASEARDAVLSALDQPGMVVFLAVRQTFCSLALFLGFLLSASLVCAFVSESWRSGTAVFGAGLLSTTIPCAGSVLQAVLHLLAPSPFPFLSLTRLLGASYPPSAWTAAGTLVDPFSLWYLASLSIIAANILHISPWLTGMILLLIRAMWFALALLTGLPPAFFV